MPSRPSSNSETARLIQGAKEGDADAYDELFAQAFARLQLFLRLRIGADLRQREDSRDLLQEAYLKAHKAFGNFEDRGPGSFGRWLCHIAENCIRERVDYHRAAKRRPPADFARVSQVLERIEAGTLGPAQRAERAEQQARLVEAMADLPSDQREVMLKRHFEGLDLASIATALGISATSVRRLIGRATLRLGALLAETEGDES